MQKYDSIMQMNLHIERITVWRLKFCWVGAMLNILL